MKKYIIKPEFIDLFGSEANAYTTIDENIISDLADYFDMAEEQVLDMLIEDDSDKHAWKLLYRFSGDRMTREQLNKLISFENGDNEDFFATKEDYIKAVEDEFVKWDCYYTTVWIDQ